MQPGWNQPAAVPMEALPVSPARSRSTSPARSDFSDGPEGTYPSTRSAASSTSSSSSSRSSSTSSSASLDGNGSVTSAGGPGAFEGHRASASGMLPL
eukprot:693060-Pyramimonas_sp.AAC.1